MLRVMNRPHFESPTHVCPDHDTGDRARRAQVPIRGVLSVVAIAAVATGGLAWLQHSFRPAAAHGWEVARHEAGRTRRDLALFFTRSSCPPCDRMRQQTLADPTLRRTMERNWVLHEVDLDAPGGDEVAEQFGVREAPALVFVTATGRQLLDSDGLPIRGDGPLDGEQVRGLLERERAGDQRRRRHHGDMDQLIRENARMLGPSAAADRG